MEFSVDRNIFSGVVQQTLGVVEKRTTAAILNNILIRSVDEDRIKIFATDTEISLISEVEAQVLEPGEIAVAARKLYEIVRELPEDLVNIKEMDNNWIKLVCGSVSYKIAGMPAVDFPEVVDLHDIELSAIGSDLLKKMITKTYFAISTDELKPNLTGVYFVSDGQSAEMVATDAHRLSVVRESLGDDIGPVSFKSQGVIIPRKGINEIRKLVEGAADSVCFGFQGKECVLKKDGTILKTILIDKEYPAYQKVVPVDSGVEIRLDKSRMLRALKRMNIVSSESFNGVKIGVGNNKITLSSVNPDIGEAIEEIDAEYNGQELEVGFCIRYLIDAIEVMEDGEMIFEVRPNYGPGIVKSTENQDYFCVIMPLKL